MLGVAGMAMTEFFRGKFASKLDVCKPDGTAKFVKKEELEGFVRRIEESLRNVDNKVERNTMLYVKVEDRTGDLEGKVILLEERQTQQWERISIQMAQTADTMREIALELKEISTSHQEYAIRLERLMNSNRLPEK